MDPRPYHYEYRKPRLSNPTFQSGRLYQSIYHMGSFTKMNANADKITNNLVSPSEARLNYKLNPQMQRERNSQKETINNDYRGRQNERYTQNEQINYGNINNYQSVRYTERAPVPRASNNYVSERYDAKLRQNNDVKPPSESRQVQQSPSPIDMYRRPSINQPDRNLMERKQSIQPRSYSQQTPSTASKQQAYMSNYGSRLMKALPGKDQDFVYERQQKPYNIISCYPRDSNAHRVYPKLTLESKLIETGQYPYLANKNGQRYLY